MNGDRFEMKSYGIGVTITAEELDAPRRLPDPWWRSPLVALGVLRPRYRKTMRQEMDDMQKRQAEAMRRMLESTTAHLLGTSGGKTNADQER